VCVREQSLRNFPLEYLHIGGIFRCVLEFITKLKKNFCGFCSTFWGRHSFPHLPPPRGQRTRRRTHRSSSLHVFFLSWRSTNGSCFTVVFRTGCVHATAIFVAPFFSFASFKQQLERVGGVSVDANFWAIMKIEILTQFVLISHTDAGFTRYCFSSSSNTRQFWKLCQQLAARLILSRISN